MPRLFGPLWRLVCIALIVFCNAAVADGLTDQDYSTIRNLAWQRGPIVAAIGTNATILVPSGFVFLDAANTQEFEKATHEISPGDEYLLAPENFAWYALFEFERIGYVRDNEKIDANVVLDEIRNATTVSNKKRRQRGWDTVTVVGWRFPPHYDSATKRLAWSILGQNDVTHREFVNYNTRLLGRTGVTSVTLVDGPKTLGEDVGTLRSLLTGFRYVKGEKYSEFKPGDRVAQYGLAALITGGAAAVATKTGFFKWIAAAAVGLWKFILAGIAAFFAGIRALFKRGK